MQTISSWFSTVIGWFLDQLKTLAVWIFDGLLTVVDSVISAIPLTALNSFPSITSLGADTLMLFGAINGWPALGMIGSAMIIRIGTGFFLK